MLLARSPRAQADGGWVCVKQSTGGLAITIFVAPAPVRAGPVDASVMVQDVQTGTPALDAEVTLHVAAGDPGGEPLELAATRAQATNKLLYASQFVLPAPGTWTISATVRRAEDVAEATCELTAAEALPPVLAYWPYLALPPVVVALFALHQWLSRNKSNG